MHPKFLRKTLSWRFSYINDLLLFQKKTDIVYAGQNSERKYIYFWAKPKWLFSSRNNFDEKVFSTKQKATIHNRCINSKYISKCLKREKKRSNVKRIANELCQYIVDGWLSKKSGKNQFTFDVSAKEISLKLRRPWIRTFTRLLWFIFSLLTF